MLIYYIYFLATASLAPLAGTLSELNGVDKCYKCTREDIYWGAENLSLCRVILSRLQSFLLLLHWENEETERFFFFLILWSGYIFISSRTLLIKLLKMFAKDMLFYLICLSPNHWKHLRKVNSKNGNKILKC